MPDSPGELAGGMPIPDQAAGRSRQHTTAQSRDSWPDFLLAIRLRRRTLIATILIVPFCAWLVLRQVTPMYTATGALIYQASEYQSRELQSMMRPELVTEAVMATQAEVLQSLHIAEQVAQRGHLFENPVFNPTLRPPDLLSSWLSGLRALLGIEDDAATPEPVYGPVRDAGFDATLLAVRSALRASPVHFSHTIEVSFVAAEPVLAAAAVNNAMDAYIKGLYFARHQNVEQGTAHLETQAKELRRQVERDEERISDFRQRHGLSQGIHGTTPTEQITRLTEDLIKAKADRTSASSRLEAARGNGGTDAEVAPSVVQARARVAQLAERIQAQRMRLGREHPEAQALARQYAEAERTLVAEVAHVVASMEAEYRTASDRVAALEHNLIEAQRAADQSARDQVPLNDMVRTLDARRQQLAAVLEDIQKTVHQTAIELPEAHEISLALPPEAPSSPRRLQSMAAATAAGVFLALVLVQVLQVFDDTLRSGDAIRSLTGLPCFALIPEVSGRALRHLKVQDYVTRRPLTAFAEQVRAVRAALCLETGRPKVITVTSARPSEGKTLLTLSLGRSARSGYTRVVAIECDVRQPSFQRRLGGQVQAGLLDILRGEAAWRDIVQEDRLTGMAFIAAGRIGKPGSDILALYLSDQMRSLLADLRQHYDLILLDSPPVEAMTEARVIASLSDATLLCVRWHGTGANTLLHAVRLLKDAHAKIIGTVLTRVDTSEHLRSGNADAGVYHRRYRSYFRG